jgi:secondary thiamine-phosphate synthase enzyme
MRAILAEGDEAMKVFSKSIGFSTKGEIDFFDISSRVQDIVSESGIENGVAHVFAPHATGILVLTEYEPDLLEDTRNMLERLIPKRGNYAHPSNAHSHLRSLLLSPEKTLPVVEGRVELGTWQSLVFVETDVYPRQRTIIVQVLGE